MSKINNFMVSKLAAFKARNVESEEGQGLAEYGLVLALIAAVCVAALTLLGENVRDKINSVATSV